MGARSCKGAANSNKAITIAILGLDNAGKTTTARVLEKAPVDSVAPTIGFSQTEVLHKDERIKLIDLGGGETFREAWRHYYDDAYGFVYVLDSSQESRLGENRDVLKKLLREEKVKGKPILILANKQDKPEALDKNAILEDLKIERLVNENQTLCRVELCTATSLSRSGKNSKIDDSIRHGFDWLIKVVYENYDALHERVEKDVQKRNEAEQNSRRERQERVQKLREERDRQEGTENGNDEDDDAMKNGFVPIGQAVKNAERNSSEKPTKDKSSRVSSSEKIKSKTVNANTSLPPIPAPRSSSHSRTLIADENSDDQERPRRHSTEISPRRKESPVPRSTSSNFDENQSIDSTDERTSIRSITGKKKKVIGAGRHRLNGDTLPPLAPSSATSRRDDLIQNKGPPVGTPRPQALVAQWAITSPSPQSTAEKLTTIASDNELDDDEGKYKSLQITKRTGSPHPNTTNRIIHDKKNELAKHNNENLINSDYKKSSRDKQHHTNLKKDDDDENDNGNISRRSSSAQRSRSKLNNEDDEDKFNESHKKHNLKEQDHYSKQHYDRHNDNDINENLMDGDYKRSSRHKQHTDLNKNDNDDYDDNNNENISRELPAIQKSRSKLNNEDELINNRKTNHLKEQDRYSKQHYDTNNDNDDDENFNHGSSRRTISSARKTAAGGGSSHRSYSKTDENVDDELR
ncbi:unnamed protein product [Rotaria sp. Silwood2]|nr:unnamed protein product [Rotaria sp. Silwood2]CAF4030389.1 unnamed protein product [Rotaria sp. Silwood2]CAF4140055.1 unnamed protein product [Rotaria sp. Silwood2]